MTSVAAAAAAAALDTLAQLMPGAPRLLLLVIPLTVLVLIGAAQLLQEEERSAAEGATVVVIGAPNAATDLDIAGLAEALSAADLRHLAAQLRARAAATEDERVEIPVQCQETHLARPGRSGHRPPAPRLGVDEGAGARLLDLIRAAGPELLSRARLTPGDLATS